MLGTKQVLTISSSLIPFSPHLNACRNNTCALHPVKSGGWNWVTERLWLLKCQGIKAPGVDLCHSPVPCRDPRLPRQGPSTQPHLSEGATPTADPQPRIQAKEPRAVPIGVPCGHTCVAHLHFSGPSCRALLWSVLTLPLSPHHSHHLQWTYLFVISEPWVLERSVILQWPQRSQWTRPL